LSKKNRCHRKKWQWRDLLGSYCVDLIHGGIGLWFKSGSKVTSFGVCIEGRTVRLSLVEGQLDI
jgi:hypothetical protein